MTKQLPTDAVMPIPDQLIMLAGLLVQDCDRTRAANLLMSIASQVAAERQAMASALLSLPDTNGYGLRCHHCGAEAINMRDDVTHQEGCIVLLAEAITKGKI